MARCSNVMQALRDEFPPLLASLESIIDTMLRDLKENWCETLLRDLRVIIRQLHVIQYKNRSARLAPRRNIKLPYVGHAHPTIDSQF